MHINFKLVSREIHVDISCQLISCELHVQNLTWRLNSFEFHMKNITWICMIFPMHVFSLFLQENDLVKETWICDSCFLLVLISKVTNGNNSHVSTWNNISLDLLLRATNGNKKNEIAIASCRWTAIWMMNWQKTDICQDHKKWITKI